MEIADCVRIFELQPGDDFVEKRKSAIKDLKGQFAKVSNYADIFALSARASLVFHEEVSRSDAFAKQVATAIRKQSAAFVEEGHELEIGVCGLAALVLLLEEGKSSGDTILVPDAFGAAVWLALSYLPQCEEVRLERLRQAAISAARARITRLADRARARKVVPDFEEPAAGVALSVERLSEMADEAISTLRHNAAIDREEIDLLWWVLSEYSEILEKRLESLSTPARAIVVGLEVASKMRAFPGQGIRNLAARGLPEETKDLSEVMAAIGADRKIVCDSYSGESIVDRAPQVFPLLHALRADDSSGAGSEISRKLSDWASRALLEMSVVRLQHEKTAKT
jgi:hypothetical protein